MNPVGYLFKSKDGLIGQRGTHYDYVLAENGLFVEAENAFLAARVPVFVTTEPVRGLAPLEQAIVLRHGLIPSQQWELVLNVILGTPRIEWYLGLRWDELRGYHSYIANQTQGESQVEYEIGQNVLVDIHSHGETAAFFSIKDNKDEVGFKVYGVVGNTVEGPEVIFRVGIYGHFAYIRWSDVFSGSLTGAYELDVKIQMADLAQEFHEFLDTKKGLCFE